MIKMMTGLYDSYEGRILVNGKELREYSPQEKKSLYAVVFQDFARYQTSVKDMIGLGMRGQGAQMECQDTGKVLLAAEQVGLSEFVDGLADEVAYVSAF